MNTTKLRNNIEAIQERIIAYRKIIDNNSNDFSSQLALSSLESHKRDLTKQLREELLCHSKEIVELHLTGEKVKRGEVPLRLLADISEYFTRAIQNASNRIINGYDSKKVPQYIQSSLNLNFVGLSFGSSRLLISADTNPDIFGNSLSENTLKKVFEIFSYENVDDFLESIDTVGLKSLKNWHSIFSRCLHEKVQIDINWFDSEAKQYFWNGNNEHLTKWKKRIEMISSKDLPPLTTKGYVFLVSLSGRIEIMQEDEHKIKAIYPVRLFDIIRTISIGDNVICRFKRKQVIDMTKGIEKTTYTLDTIEKE